MRFIVIVSGFALLSAVGFGCNKTNAPPPNSVPPLAPNIGGPPPATYTGDFPDGWKVYEANNCMKCHGIPGAVAAGPGGPGRDMPGPGGRGPGGAGPGGRGGPGGPGPGGPGGRGPNLGHVGANHDATWLTAHVRDPQAHKPESRMPKFGEDKINADDLKKLADYLASLK